MKTILYARRSSEGDEKQLKSIPAQIEEMGELLKRNNHDVIRVFEESHSAKESGQRPMFEEMLRMVRAKEATAIAVWAPDRISRNPIDAARVIELMDKDYIEEVITPQSVYHNTPMEKAMLMFMMVNAKLENDNKSLNVKRGMREKARRGEYPFSNPPTGYKRVDKYTITPDEKASTVRKIFELYATGNYSIAQLARELKQQGFESRSSNRYFHKGYLYKLLNLQSYTGYIEVQGELYHLSKVEPIVPVALYNIAQDVLHGRFRSRPKQHLFAFTGLMSCPDCGCSITATKKIKNGREYHYYHCTKKRGTCHQQPLSEPKLEAQLFSYIKKITLTPDMVELLITLLKKHHEKESQERTQIILNYQKEYNALQGKLDSLLEMRMNREITEEEYKTTKNQLWGRREELKTILANGELRADSWLELAENCFRNLNRLSELFENGTAEEKKRIVRAVGSNLQLKDKQLVWAYKKPLDKVAFRTQNATWQLQGESNPCYHIESVVS
jgi:site-specific DNA recombinase